MGYSDNGFLVYRAPVLYKTQQLCLLEFPSCFCQDPMSRYLARLPNYKLFLNILHKIMSSENLQLNI